MAWINTVNFLPISGNYTFRFDFRFELEKIRSQADIVIIFDQLVSKLFQWSGNLSFIIR